jgi:ribosomal protein S18 acetylase RimI-like enzyme
MQDLDRVAALWTAITRHHEPLDPLFSMRPDADGELRELLGALYRDVDAQIFVYETEGQETAGQEAGGREAGDLPGMCIVRIDRAPPILVEVERAEITDLGVREDARRRGIGRALVACALAWVKEGGVSRVEIQVAHANTEGQAFWRAEGFGDLMDVLHKRL